MREVAGKELGLDARLAEAGGEYDLPSVHNGRHPLEDGNIGASLENATSLRRD
jgi:hypothetical protein